MSTKSCPSQVDPRAIFGPSLGSDSSLDRPLGHFSEGRPHLSWATVPCIPEVLFEQDRNPILWEVWPWPYNCSPHEGKFIYRLAVPTNFHSTCYPVCWTSSLLRSTSPWIPPSRPLHLLLNYSPSLTSIKSANIDTYVEQRYLKPPKEGSERSE
jgi:hypothetical protein